MKLVDNFETNDLQEVKCYRQNQLEFDNKYIKLLKQGRAFFLLQYTGYEVKHYVLEATLIDEAIKETEQFIVKENDNYLYKGKRK